MTARRRAAVLAAVAAVVFVGLSIALRIDASGGRAAGAAAARHNPGLGIPVDRRPPPVQLVDARGRPTTLRSLRGRWVVLVPSMTLCHEVCPLTTAALMRLQRLMAAAGGRHRFVAVEVTVDPWRDTPRRLRSYRQMTGADFPLLTGSPASVRRLWRFFGVNFEKVPQGDPPDHDWMTGKPERFDVGHTDGAFVIDPSGRERLAIPGMPAVGGRIEAPLAKLLDQEGKENLQDPTPGWSAVALARRLQKMMGLSRADPGPAGVGALSSGTDLKSGKSLGEGLEALRGRPAVVNVWASWCPPCREETPLLAAADRRFGRRIAFVGADLEDDEESARGFLRRAGSDYPSFSVDTAEVADLLGPPQGTPLTFFLDRTGDVVDEHIGAYGSAAELDADLIRHLPDGAG
jgi:cytochrome oxidase Cu insertion factor (SCO1/SenC/PrrC family)/thiol-disulfide isomerase/thioredoxin